MAIQQYSASCSVYTANGWTGRSNFSFWAEEGTQNEVAESLRVHVGGGVASYGGESVNHVSMGSGGFPGRNTFETAKQWAKNDRGGAWVERTATFVGRKGVMVRLADRTQPKFIDLDTLSEAAAQEDAEGAAVYGKLLKDAQAMWAHHA